MCLLTLLSSEFINSVYKSLSDMYFAHIFFPVYGLFFHFLISFFQREVLMKSSLSFFSFLLHDFCVLRNLCLIQDRKYFLLEVLSFFFFPSQPHLWCMKVPGPGIEAEPQLQPTPQIPSQRSNPCHPGNNTLSLTHSATVGTPIVYIFYI